MCIRKLTACLLYVLFVLAPLKAAQTYTLAEAAEAEQGILLISESGNRRHYSFILHTLNWENRQEGAQSYLRLSAPLAYPSQDAGKPELPVFNSIVEIPLNAVDIQLSFLVQDSLRLSLSQLTDSADRLWPRQPSLRKNTSDIPTFQRSEIVYSSESYRPSPQLYHWEDLGVMRDKRYIRLTIFPVSYEIQAAELQCVLAGDLILSWRREALAGGPEPASEGLTGYETGVETLLEHPLMMIIRADNYDPALFEAFADWKRSLGIRIELLSRSEAGSTAEGIRAMLKSRYLNSDPAQPFPDFLLLAGELEQLPAFQSRLGSWDHVTDLYYAALSDDDMLPDLSVGRLPSSTSAELSAMLRKSMNHEALQASDGSHLSRAVLIAGYDSFGNTDRYGIPTIDYGRRYRFIPENGFTEVVSFEGSGPGAPILEEVDRGVSFVNYTGHGSFSSWEDPLVSNFSLESLTNQSYPLLITNGCKTSAFDKSLSFGEAWMRHQNGGAMAYIGASNDTYWDEDLYWSVGYYDHGGDGLTPAVNETDDGVYDAPFLSRGRLTQAALISTGNMEVAKSASVFEDYYWEVYTLFGDPSLRNYWGAKTDFPDAVPLPMALPEATGSVSFRYAGPMVLQAALSRGGQLLSSGYSQGDETLTFYLDEALNGGDSLLLSLSAEGHFTVFRSLQVIEKGSLALSTDTLRILEENELQVTAFDGSGQPWSGLQFMLLEAGRTPDTLVTDENGHFQTRYRPLYGPDILLQGVLPEHGFTVFSDTLQLTGSQQLPPAQLTVSTDIRLSSALPRGLPALLRVDSPAPRHLLYRDGGQEIFAEDTAALQVTAGDFDQAELLVLREGFDRLELKVPIIRAKGLPTFRISDSRGDAIEHARLELLRDSLSVYRAESGSDGLLQPDTMDSGPYRLRAGALGYLELDTDIIIPYGDSSYHFLLETVDQTRFSFQALDVLGQGLSSELWIMDPYSDQVLYSSSTDSNGGLQMLLFPWTYRFVAVSRGYQRIDTLLTVSEEANQQFTATFLKADTLLMLYPDYSSKYAEGSKSLSQSTENVSVPTALGPFIRFARIFDIPSRVVSHSQAWSMDWGKYSASFLIMGGSNLKLGGDLLAKLYQEELFQGRMLIEGGELAYAMRQDSTFLHDILGVKKWESDGSSWNSLKFMAEHPFAYQPNPLPELMSHNGLEWVYQDIVSAADKENLSFPSNWSSKTEYPSILLDNTRKVYLPFYYLNLRSVEDEFTLLSNIFDYLGLISGPKLLSPAFVEPGSGYSWQTTGSDSLLMRWDSVVETVTDPRIHFFQGDLLFSDESGAGNYTLLPTDRLPLEENFIWFSSFQSGDSSYFTPPYYLMVQRVYVSAEQEARPLRFALEEAHPNPFNPQTRLQYQLPETSELQLRIYDLRGRLQEELDPGQQEAGVYSLHWNAGDRSSGIYFVVLSAYSPGGGKLLFRSVKKVTLLK